MAEAEIVQVLTRMFPSFGGLAPEEAGRRGDALGVYCARAWAAGPQGLAARGMPVPAEAHGRLVGVAGQVAQAQRGGLTFLVHVRTALADDPTFAQVLKGLAAAYATSLRAGGSTASQLQVPQTPPAAVKLQPPQAAPAPAPAADGGLDLMPAQDTPAREAAFADLDLMPAQDTPARAAAFDLAEDSAPGAAAGNLPAEDDSSSSQRAAAMEFLYSATESNDPDSEEASALPSDPAERAVALFERTGDDRHLEEAAAALRNDMQNAPHPMAAGMAEAGMARVHLLRGNASEAERLARSAQGRFPANPLAVEVLVRLGRGEADEVGFVTDLKQLGQALASRDVGWIGELAQAMAQAHPNEPFAYLAMFFVAHMQQDKQAKDRYLAQAWGSYPSAAHAHRCFGGEVDADLVDGLCHYGRQAIMTMDEVLLRQTVENIDSKENILAGSLRMAVGLGRVALSHSGLPRPVKRRLFFGIGKGLMGLQYYELAPDVMGKALMISPTPDEHKAISKERIQCQALWRAFDKPGIKAQQKKYVCPGTKAMTELLKQRLEGIRGDRQAREQELYSKAPTLIERSDDDPSIAREIAAAADVNSMADPLSAVRALDHELEALARTMAETEAAESGKEKSKGLFGRIKSAAAGAASAAKGAASKLKESQLKSKREEAVKNLAVSLARDLSGHDYQNPMLQAYARQAQSLEAFSDYFEAEEKKVRKLLGKLSDTI